MRPDIGRSLLRAAALTLGLAVGAGAQDDASPAAAPTMAPVESATPVATATPAGDAAPPVHRPATERPPRGAELLLPLGSIAVPGLGQYTQGAPRAGLAFSAVSVGGLATFAVASLPSRDRDLEDFDALSARDQLGLWAVLLGQDAGLLSAYDSFHRSLPALQAEGKYAFLTRTDSSATLLKAPLEVHFLKRKTSYIPAALVLGLAIAERAAGPDAGKEFAPWHVHDGLFTLGVSYNAGVSEEAVFRGYMMPALRQHLGGHALVPNLLQAGVFAAGHGTTDPAQLGFLVAFGLFDGCLANHNKGSLRQNVFNHFLWDVVAVSAELLTRQRGRPGTSRHYGITLRF